MSLNSVTLVGHLGADPELRTTPSGKAVCTMRLATRRARGDEADWHEITVWDDQGQRCHDHLKKGSLVGVQGRIQYRTWDGDDGKKRKSAGVVAHRVAFLGGRRTSDATERARQFPAQPQSAQGEGGLPF